MKHRQRGITLMELMVVMTIVGILAAIAIPSYRMYVVRANRSDAKTALLGAAQSLERCYTNSTPYAYNSATCTAAVPNTWLLTPPTYRINVVATATAYVLSAVPQAGQATNDTQCATFRLSSAGAQTITGSGLATDCWRR